MILLFFLLAAADATPSLGNSVSEDMHWGENISLEGYRLEAADFSTDVLRPLVFLKLYKANELLIQRLMAPGENFTFDDAVMVEVDSILIPDSSVESDEPMATVRLGLYAAPEILLHLTPEKESYEPGEEIRMKLAVENQGTETAKSIKIQISSNPKLVDYSYRFSDLKAGEIETQSDGSTEKTIRFKAPRFAGPQELSVKARAVYSDEVGRERESTVYSVVGIKGPLSFNKRVEETMKLGKSYPVTLSLRNMGDNAIAVDLSDAIADGFSTTSSLSWKVKVDPGKTEIVSYDLVPNKAGDGQVLPAATAIYEAAERSFQSQSNSLSVDVVGPHIAVEKRISPSIAKPGDDVEVQIDIINEGNQTVKVSVNDSMPEWASLVRGQTGISRLLVAGDKISLSYTIAGSEPGDYEIPETVVLYNGADGLNYRMNSSTLNLKVEEEKFEGEKPAVNMTLPQQNAKEEINSSAPSADVRPSKGPAFLWALPAALLLIIYALLGRIL